MFHSQKMHFNLGWKVGYYTKNSKGAVHIIIFPAEKDHFPSVFNAPKVAELVQPLKPDLLIYWGNFQTIAACVGLRHLPFVAILGEPPHFPEWFRIRPPFRAWAYRLTYPFWRQSMILHINRRLALRLLKNFQTVWCTVTYLTNWYRGKHYV